MFSHPFVNFFITVILSPISFGREGEVGKALYRRNNTEHRVFNVLIKFASTTTEEEQNHYRF